MPHSIPDVLKAFAAGEIVVVTDDHNREGEGDLIVADSACTAEKWLLSSATLPASSAPP